jgi:hypothetical protein
MTMDENVAKAREELDAVHDQRFAPWRGQWQTIRARLVELEAETAGLRADLHDADERCLIRSRERTAATRRAEKADALLREAHPFVPITYSSTGQPQLHARITAHLRRTRHD